MPARAAWRPLRAIISVTAVATLSVLSTVALGTSSASAIGGGNASTTQFARQQTNLPPVSFRANHAANVAIAQIGDPYRYGAAGPNSFDCSGLTMYSYAHARLSLPRTAAGQYSAVRHILKQNLQRGDLVFFHTSSGHVYHAAIFLYWNRDHRAVIVHAPYPGQRVHRAPVWTSSWYAGTRRPMH